MKRFNGAMHLYKKWVSMVGMAEGWGAQDCKREYRGALSLPRGTPFPVDECSPTLSDSSSASSK